MITVHDADEHAPYAHLIITPVPRGTVRPKRGKPALVPAQTPALVVCAFCAHWVKRPLTGCKCIASCHAESIETSTSLQRKIVIEWSGQRFPS